MAGEFENHGWDIVSFGEKADAVVIHTCAVTEESARKSRQIARRAKRLCPNACVSVVGCLSQTDPEKLKSIADIVLGSADKKNIVPLVTEFIEKQEKEIVISDIAKEKEFEKMTLVKGEKTRAQIKIEDGCNNFCSYCIIPYARGRVRSKPIDEAVSETAGLVKNGYSEIVFTGIHLDSYGKDFGTFGLLDLLERVDLIPGLQRIRLGSLEPIFINSNSVSRLQNIKHLCPHFHLSLQSGCDETLKRMNRHYSSEEFSNAVKSLRENFDNVSITTDMIVGFPGETDEEFEKSYSFAEKVSFSKIHVFPFSPRKGTRAFDMKNPVDAEQKRQRVSRLINLNDKLETDFLNKQKGRVLSVLFEQKKDGNFIGYAENYVQVAVETDENLENIIRKVKIERVSGGICFGALEKNSKL